MATDPRLIKVPVHGALWCRAPCERPSLVKIPIAGHDAPPHCPAVRYDIRQLRALHYTFVWGDIEAAGKAYRLNSCCTS